MGSNQEIIYTQKPRGGGRAAVKESCRVIATTFLSLLLPLSFLLLARLSTARYFLSVADDKTVQSHKINPFLNPLFLYSKATVILSLLISLVTFAALSHGLTGNKSAFLINALRRLHAALVLLLLTQICLRLGIPATVDAEINSYTVGSLVLPRRVVFALGLHETMVFWRRNVVKPVVDEAVFGFPIMDFSWVEMVALAVAFGNLWWRRLREEVEALVVLPWVRVELGMNVGVADVMGWSLYYLTVAVGVITAAKCFIRVVKWVFRY